MTEQELLSQAAKLKAIYAQNANTTRQNSIASMNADKASYTADANNQLTEQQGTTQNIKTNADINAFNNAKKLRELASSGGFTNGGELYSGIIQNEQQKGNTIGTANSDYAKYKGQWDQKLNEYNTKWNNNLNKLNSETDNSINEYNVKTDMEYGNKIDSLRQAQAAARAAATKAASVSKTELTDAYKQMLVGAMGNGQGGDFLWGNYSKIVGTIGQSGFDTLNKYYNDNAKSQDKNSAGNVLGKYSDSMKASNRQTQLSGVWNGTLGSSEIYDPKTGQWTEPYTGKTKNLATGKWYDPSTWIK